jgi:hypothetical protein
MSEERSLEEVKAELQALMGVTDDDPRMRPWRIMRNSQRDCSCCGQCGKTLAPDERVYRTRISLWSMFGSWSHNLAALCQGCGQNSWQWKYHKMRPKPCAGCGREVWSELRWYLTAPVTCCEQCAHKVRLAAARNRRTEARGTRKCQQCGETFEPTRTDAKFCKNACRQNAYRRRYG